MRPLTLSLGFAFLLAAAPAFAQQGHDHEAGSNGEAFVVLHDLEPRGHAVVGSLSHLGFALVKDGVPVDHRDATFRLEQNGVVLFETADTHEYDGLFSFEYTFTTPGPYTVVAESDTGARGEFSGTATTPRDVLEPTVDLTVPDSVPAGMPGAFGVRVLDAAGELVDHTDALLEVRRARDGLLVHRVHAHTHAEPMKLDLAFAEPGEYVAWVVGYDAYPTGKRAEFASVLATKSFQVTAPAGAPLASVLPARAAAPAASPGHAGTDYKLALKIDPSMNVGPLNHVRLSGLVWNDSAQDAVQHVDFEAVLTGPLGAVFQSETLHEYDGHFELLAAGLPPGLYTFHLKAERGAWHAEDALEFRVAPPALPIGAGVNAVSVEGLDDLVAGEPADLTFRVATPGDALGVIHSEVDVTILDGTGMPLLAGKLHGHEGVTRATVTFPDAGEYVIRIDADTLFPSPSLYRAPDGTVGMTSILTAQVAEGPGLPLPVEALDGAAEPTLTVPGPGVALAAGLLAVLALALQGNHRRGR